MYQNVRSFFRVVPVAFAAAFVAGSTGCIINANDFLAEGEGENCVVLEEICPSLVCASDNVIVEGCAICECADEPIACEDDKPVPECAEPIRLDDCSWTCGGDACVSDSDCRDDEFCAFVGTDAPSDDSGEAAQRPEPTGVCLAKETSCAADSDCGDGASCENGTCVDNAFDCFSDADCFLGELCIFDGGDNGSEEGADIARSGTCQLGPDTICSVDDECSAGFHCEAIDSPEAPNGLVAPAPGICVVDDVLSCNADQQCRRGQHCDYSDVTNAIVAAPGVCVDDVVDQGCESDADCNGGICELSCQGDPTCPECDVCFFVGTCIDTDCTTDGDCGDNQFCDVGQLAPPAPECDVDGANCDVPLGTGVCRDIVIIEARCTSDDECGNGRFCDFGTDPNDALRPAPCDPAIGCDPVAPAPEGSCRDIVVVSTCSTDADCGGGEFCDLGDTIGLRRPCLDENGDGVCDDVVINEGICRPLEGPASCVGDLECAEDQVCLLDTCYCPAVCIDDGHGGCVPCECAPYGTCIDVVIDDVCFSDEGCGDGRFCNLGTTDENGRRAFPATGICEDLPIAPTPCVDDGQCIEGQICVFTESTVDPDGTGRSGECKAAPTR